MAISYHFQIFYVQSVRQILFLCPSTVSSTIYIVTFQQTISINIINISHYTVVNTFDIFTILSYYCKKLLLFIQSPNFECFRHSIYQVPLPFHIAS